ncbi:unnamed protein product [Arctogadus glacialis]
MSTTGRRPGTAAPRGAVLTVLFTVAVVHLSVGVCRSLSSNGLTRDGGSREMVPDSDPVLDQRQPGESSATDPSGETPFSGAADPSEPLPFVRTGPEGGGGDGAVRTAPFLLVSGRRRSLAEGLQLGPPHNAADPTGSAEVMSTQPLPVVSWTTPPRNVTQSHVHAPQARARRRLEEEMSILLS